MLPEQIADHRVVIDNPAPVNHEIAPPPRRRAPAAAGCGIPPLVLSFVIHMHQHAGRHVEQRAVGKTQAVAAGERALHRQGEAPLRIEPVQRASLAVKHQTQRAGQRWMGAGDRRQRFVEQGTS
jgi:hypothetical protein